MLLLFSTPTANPALVALFVIVFLVVFSFVGAIVDFAVQERRRKRKYDALMAKARAEQAEYDRRRAPRNSP